MAKSERKFPGDLTPEEIEFVRLLQERYGWQMERCPSPDLLRALSEEILPEQAAQLVSAHVQSCSICSVLKQDLAAIEPAAPTQEQLKRVRQRIPPKSVFSGWFRPIPVFAAIAAAALGIWIVRSWISHGSGGNEAQNPPSPPPRQQQAVEITFSKAPIEIPSNMLMTYRGAADNALPSSEEWIAALKLYKEDDFARAAVDLGKIATRYPRFADADFYRGVSLLLLNRNTDAIPALQKAVELGKGQRLTEARWYLGVALAKAGKLSDAIQQWQQVCDAHATYSEEACRDLPRLKQAQ